MLAMVSSCYVRLGLVMSGYFSLYQVVSLGLVFQGVMICQVTFVRTG
jgi:hypothetical protein